VASIKHIFNELHYEMTRKIAEGGMGVVYEAVQLGAGNFKKVVAVKLIREEYSAIEEFQNNFIGEARLVADLIHTNIVQTYHLGQVGGQYFMVMEFVKGVNLEQFLERTASSANPSRSISPPSSFRASPAASLTRIPSATAKIATSTSSTATSAPRTS
jgi:serine/threonine protein kinase